jgi:hypothetical protein
MRTRIRSWRRLVVLLATLATVAALSAVVSAPASAKQPRGGATPLICQTHGSVVFMQYAMWAKPPASNGCWTIIRPLTADSGSYKNCDMSASTPKVTGSGTNWIYDDTNVNGHGGSSDQTLDNTYCGGRSSWWGEYMAASGGFIERWSPTYLFEENYNSSHGWVAFTQSVNYTGSNPTVGPIPTIDVATSSVSSHITSECHDAADYPSDYWFSIYNGSSLTTTLVDTIDAALNSCYHT